MNNSPIPNVEEAREQAAEYVGFAVSTKITVGNEIVDIPHPSLLTDEQQMAYNELQISREQWDSEEIPVTGADGTVRTVTRPKDPPRKNGKALPPEAVQLCIALFGEKEYARLHAAGLQASDVYLHWVKMNRQYQERQIADLKSVGRLNGVAAVADAD